MFREYTLGYLTVFTMGIGVALIGLHNGLLIYLAISSVEDHVTVFGDRMTDPMWFENGKQAVFFCADKVNSQENTLKLSTRSSEQLLLPTLPILCLRGGHYYSHGTSLFNAKYTAYTRAEQTLHVGKSSLYAVAAQSLDVCGGRADRPFGRYLKFPF